MASKRATPPFAFLDCSRPIRCNAMSGCAARNAGHFAFASCTRFSPNTRWPAAITGSIASAPNVFDTAISVTEAGSRLPSAHAAAISPRTRASEVLASASITASITEDHITVSQSAFPARRLDATNEAGIQRRDFIVTPAQLAGRASMDAVDSTYAWIRLAVALVLGTIGSAGLWSYVVALPPVQADFGIDRGAASVPYTMAMMGFAFGGVAMGRLADRFGIVFPAILGSVLLGGGYIAASYAPNIWTLDAAHILIGAGASGTFGPIISDMSHWFKKRRGIAIAIASSGNYLSGAVWPPIIQYFIET